MSWFLNSIVILGTLSYAGVQLYRLWKQAKSVFTKTYLVCLTLLHYAASFGFYMLIDKTDVAIDAVRYYQTATEASSWGSIFAIGHGIISFLIYPLTELNITLPVLFFVFATISLKGFYIYLELVGVTKFNRLNKFLLLLFLLPSAHYWTGFLGKDAITFLLLALVLLKVKQNTYNWSLGLVLLLLFAVRPHVFFVVLLGLSLVYIFDKSSVTIKKRQFIALIMSASSLALIIGLWYFVRVENLSVSGINQSLEQFIEYTVNMGETAISLKETTIITRIGYLLFMPLPFIYPIYNAFIVASMLENTLLLVLTIFAIRYFIKKPFKWSLLSNDIRFAIITSALLIVLFGAYVYNLGLANRMRMVFLPYIFYAVIMLISKPFYETKNN